jgi:hypothetical protein
MIFGARVAQRARETLENSFDLVMTRSSVEDLDVEIRAGMIYEAAEEILHQFRLKIAYHPDSNFVAVDQRRASAQVERDHGQRFIHGHDEVTRSVDAFAIAESFGEKLTQYDADIFHGVVLVDIQVAGGLQLQIESAVFRKQLQHVIEKADAGGDVVLSPAVDFQRAADLRFLCVPLNASRSH